MRTLLTLLLFSSLTFAQQPSRSDWGAMPVTVNHQRDSWLIQGNTNQVILNEVTLGLSIKTGNTAWDLSPSVSGDMLVRTGSQSLFLRLADAKKKAIVPY